MTVITLIPKLVSIDLYYWSGSRPISDTISKVIPPKYNSGVQYDIIIAFSILPNNDKLLQWIEDRNGNRIYLKVAWMSNAKIIQTCGNNDVLMVYGAIRLVVFVVFDSTVWYDVNYYIWFHYLGRICT